MGDKKKAKQDTAERGVNEAANILPTSRSRPIFDASGRGPCHAVLTYEACLRLCINSWVKDRTREALHFLENDCSKLREAFGLNQVLLRSQEEQLRKKPSEIASEAAAPKPKKSVGKMKAQVGEVKMQSGSSRACEEIVALDFLLEVAMKVKKFEQKKWLLDGPWEWLVNEFASYHGVSAAYTKLRYLSYVMQVATPTKDCLTLILDSLTFVRRKIRRSSEQHMRLLGEIEDQVRQILPRIFENYKSLDESSPTGMTDDFKAATGSPPPALLPAVKLYGLLHDISSPEIQQQFCRYFQAAAKKRSARHLAETDELINNKGASISTSYPKMGLLVSSIRKEIRTDIRIHEQNILPSFIDLPNLSAPIYSMDLCSRLKAFLVAHPPPGPSPPVIELVIATADFQRKLSSWKINPVNEGANAKVLFHSCITRWIEKKCLSLCDKCSGTRTQQKTASFIEEMYDQLMKTLNEYKEIISRWPEYSINLENATADVEEAVSKALQRQYADVLAPLDSPAPSTFGKYVQIITKGTAGAYIVPKDLGVPLNSMKILVELHSKIESWFKPRRSYTPPGGTPIPGERLSKIRLMLNENFRKYIQAIGDKLAKNTKDRSEKILKKVIKDSKKIVIESEVRSQMQPLETLLKETIENLHSVFDPHVFKSVCRSLWDGMGQVVLHFLEKRKGKTSGYKGLTIAISILDENFKSQMQKLLVGALKEKDLNLPESVMGVHSQLAKKS